MKTGIFFHPSFLLHDPGNHHPENPFRLKKIIEVLNGSFFNQLEFFDCPYVTTKQLNRVHSKSYIEKIINYFPLNKTIKLDNDTMISPGSLEACMRAPGAVISAIEMVMKRKIKNAFCAVRPPGHHAEFSSGMGFCIFNNIAVGAAYAREELCLEKVAIIDIDVHHGNGTEDWVRGNDNFLFFSVHQSPLYPGTGLESNNLEGINNYTLLPGSNSIVFREVINNKLTPLLEQFKPELILISMGFDGHKLDKLAEINLSSLDYGWVTEEICKLAKKCCEGRIVSVLEGGYNLDALAESGANHVASLMKF